jgi:hypothetical protein
VTPSTANSKSALQHAARQWQDYQLRLIEQRLGVVLTTMANLKIEQDRLRVESQELIERRERIINPPPPPEPERQRAPKGEGRQHEKRNAYMRVYMRKVRAARRVDPEKREKYNKYQRDLMRKRAQQSSSTQPQL